MFDGKHLAPLFALDWVTTVIFGVGIVIWILNQLFGKEDKAPNPPRRRVPQAGGRPAGASPVDEIDRFLREIASRRKEGREQAPEMEVLRPQTVEKRTVRPVPQRRRAVQPERSSGQPRSRPESKATPPVAKPRRPLSESHIETHVDDHVREHLTSDVSQHVREYLGVSPISEKSAAPAVSSESGPRSLFEETGPAARSRGAAPESLATLLSSGVGLRQAVVLTEIFGPPRSRRPLRG